MTTTTPTTTPPAPPRPRRHWLRWTVTGLALFLVLLVGLIAAAIKLQPVPAPLALPPTVTAPAGPSDATYRPGPGSLAGFRIPETVIGLTTDVVGRTGDVAGTVTIAGGRATAAELRIGLVALTSGGGKPAPQLDLSLETGRYPDATVALTEPVALDPAFTAGTAITVNATGTLTLHGVTRTVTAALTLRRNGTGIDVAGSLPVSFADYGIAGPAGYGWFGSMADHGRAEFLLVLQPS
jgi:polyisoprenoid-binding protein YceI